MTTGVVFGIGSMLGWGVADFLAARSSKAANSLVTFFWTQVSGLALLVLLFPGYGGSLTVERELMPWLLLATILFVVVYLLLYYALGKGVVSIVSPVFAANALVAMIIGLVVFREQVTALGLLAASVVITGLLLVSSDWRAMRTYRGQVLTKGVLEAIAGMLLAGIFFAVLTHLSRNMGWFMPMVWIRTGSLLIACLLALLPRQVRRQVRQNARQPLLAGVVDSLGFLSFNLGVQAAPVALVAPVAGSFPLVTILLALIFLRERPAPNQWVGVAAILVGIVTISIA